MRIDTTRFGQVEIEPHDLIHFPSGILGLQNCRQWVLLADAENESLGWLQCISHNDVAMAVVSPRRFVPNYQVRVSRRVECLGVGRIARCPSADDCRQKRARNNAKPQGAGGNQLAAPAGPASNYQRRYADSI